MYSDRGHNHGYKHAHHYPSAPLSDASRYHAPGVFDFGTCVGYHAHSDKVDESHREDDHIAERLSGSDHQGWFHKPELVIQVLYSVGLVVLRV